MRSIVLLSACVLCYTTDLAYAASPKHTSSKKRPQVEEVNVSARHNQAGGGMMVRHTTPKTVSTITSAYISQQSPLSTVAALVGNIPGVVSAAEGPLTTTYETFHIRGMDRTEIGFVFEGMPGANPFTYSVYTPALVDSENLGSISVMQGSANLTAPSYNSVGAEVDMTLRKPENRQKMIIEGSGGTRSVNKEFVRYDTGEIGRSGVYAFVSGSYSSSHLWRGPGAVSRWHLDAALTKSWNASNDSEILFGYNKAEQTVFLLPSLAQWQKYGIGYTTSGVYSGSGSTFYQLNKKNTGTTHGAIKNHFSFGHGLTLDAEAYSVKFEGPYQSASPVPISNGYIGTAQYSHLDGHAPAPGSIPAINYNPWFTTSSGLSLLGTWKHQNNTLEASYWYSFSNEAAWSHYYPLNAQGQWTRNNGYLTAFGGLPINEDNENAFQQLNNLALDDKFTLFNDHLTVDAGFRISMVSRQYTQDLPGATPYKSIHNVFVPNPQLLVSYRIDPENQIYVNATTGYHMPGSVNSQVAIYSHVTGQPQSAPLDPYVPEYMIGEELGYRYTGRLMFNAAAFHYDLTHHQISSSSYEPGSTTMVSSVIDAGGESANGIQAELATHPWHHTSLYASGQYMHTSLGNNIAYQGDYARTRGKQEVGAPKFLASIGLSYDDTVTFARFSLHYSDAQYATLMNDQGIPAHFTSDLSFGRYLPKFGRIAPRVMLNLINLGDAHYLSSVYGYTVAATKQQGVYGRSLTGAQPSYVVGSGFAAIASLSATFE